MCDIIGTMSVTIIILYYCIMQCISKLSFDKKKRIVEAQVLVVWMQYDGDENEWMVFSDPSVGKKKKTNNITVLYFLYYYFITPSLFQIENNICGRDCGRIDPKQIYCIAWMERVQ